MHLANLAFGRTGFFDLNQFTEYKMYTAVIRGPRFQRSHPYTSLLRTIPFRTSRARFNAGTQCSVVSTCEAPARPGPLTRDDAPLSSAGI